MLDGGGVELVSPSSIGDLLDWWYSWKFKGVRKMIWEVIHVVVLSSVWYQRNKLFFEGSTPIWDEIIEQIKYRVAFWVKIRLKAADYSINDFVFNLESLKEAC